MGQVVGLDSMGQLVATWWVVWRLYVVLWCRLISIYVILVCNGVGLVVQ